MKFLEHLSRTGGSIFSTLWSGEICPSLAVVVDMLASECLANPRGRNVNSLLVGDIDFSVIDLILDLASPLHLPVIFFMYIMGCKRMVGISATTPDTWGQLQATNHLLQNWHWFIFGGSFGPTP
jgi:hypothetical protein